MGSASDLRPRRSMCRLPESRRGPQDCFSPRGRGGMCEYPLGNPRLMGRPELARHGGIRPDTSRNALPGGCAELKWARVRARNGDVKRVCPEKKPASKSFGKVRFERVAHVGSGAKHALIWIKHGRRSSAILALRNGRFVAAE